MLKKGIFVNFEGIDGSGTSTHVHELGRRIEKLNKYQDFVKTHEPWANSEIKRRLAEDTDAYSHPMEMANLFIPDRTKHSKLVIRPNLKAGMVILNSRYKLSTCAFQWTQGLNLYDLLEMQEDLGLVIPDITYFLDVPRTVAEQRMKDRGDPPEKFERDVEFKDKVIRAYNALIGLAQVDERLFGKVVRINGNRSIDDVANDVYKEFLDIYNERPRI